MCLLTHERYKIYQKGFSFSRLGHAPGLGLGGTVGGGVWGSIFCLKFDQIWFVSYLHEWHMHRCHFLVPAPWGLVEGPNIFTSELLSQYPRFLIKLCVSSHKWKMYNISDGIFNRPPESCPEVSLGGTVGGLGQISCPKFNQIWCVNYSHEWHNSFGPRPLGLVEGPNIFTSELLRQYLRF